MRFAYLSTAVRFGFGRIVDCPFRLSTGLPNPLLLSTILILLIISLLLATLATNLTFGLSPARKVALVSFRAQFSSYKTLSIALIMGLMHREFVTLLMERMIFIS